MTRITTSNLAPPDWTFARCRNYDPELFYSPDTEEQAKQICQRCPIRDVCRNWALEVKEQFGVWGGLGENERRVTGYRKHRVRCPSCRGDSVHMTYDGRNQICESCGLSWLV